jgi:hypothetical protein
MSMLAAANEPLHAELIAEIDRGIARLRERPQG